MALSSFAKLTPVRVWALVIVAQVVLLAGCASVETPATSPTIPLGAVVAAPVGFRKMCDADPSVCVYPPAPLVLAATLPDYDRELELLERANWKVNGDTRQTQSLEPKAEEGPWSRTVRVGNIASGDCDEIAVEKRALLIKAGFPVRQLRFAMVYRRDLGLHIVLIARTTRGDVMLDSRSPWIVPWNDAPYNWVEVQSEDDPMVWRKVAMGPDRVPQPSGFSALMKWPWLKRTP